MRSHHSTQLISAIQRRFDLRVRELGARDVKYTHQGSTIYGRAHWRRPVSLHPGDDFFGGVAFRAEPHGVSVHPHYFRLVCSNGLVEMVEPYAELPLIDVSANGGDLQQTLLALDAQIDQCADPRHLDNALGDMRLMSRIPVDEPLELLDRLDLLAFVRRSSGLLNVNTTQPPASNDDEEDWMTMLVDLLTEWAERVVGSIKGVKLPGGSSSGIVHLPKPAEPLEFRIERHFNQDGDRSLYGLMNAVTATAREVRSPNDNWTLELVGGQLLLQARQIRRLQERQRVVIPSRGRSTFSEFGDETSPAARSDRRCQSHGGQIRWESQGSRLETVQERAIAWRHQRTLTGDVSASTPTELVGPAATNNELRPGLRA